MATKTEIKKEIKSISDTIDIESLNKLIDIDGQLGGFEITRKTLTNIGEWALDGKSQFEIARNLELTPTEFQYLIKMCPAILLVMEHSQAYADIVVAGTLFQTAVGGKIVKKKVPMKVKEYDNGKVIGEHYEMIEVEEITEPNPMLLKYLAEHKLSEKFGDNVKDNSKEHREIIDQLTDEERKIIEGMKQND